MQTCLERKWKHMDHKFYSFYFHFRHRITQWELSILKTHLEEKKTTITNPSQTGVQLRNTMFAQHGVKLSESKRTLWLCWSIMMFCGLEWNSMVEYFSTTQIQNGSIRGLNLELIYTKHRMTEPLWQHTPYTPAPGSRGPRTVNLRSAWTRWTWVI